MASTPDPSADTPAAPGRRLCYWLGFCAQIMAWFVAISGIIVALSLPGKMEPFRYMLF